MISIPNDALQPQWPNCATRNSQHPARNLQSASQGLQNHCAFTPAPDPVNSQPLCAYSLSPQVTDSLIQQDIEIPAAFTPCWDVLLP